MKDKGILLEFRKRIDEDKKYIFYWIFKPLKLLIRLINGTKIIYYYKDLNLVFYHMPKCAGSYIRESLAELSEYKSISKRKADRLKDVFRFTFRRDPIKRLESAWRYTSTIEKKRLKYGFSRDCDFGEWLSKTRKGRFNIETHSKTFYELYRNVQFDFIGWFENIE